MSAYRNIERQKGKFIHKPYTGWEGEKNKEIMFKH